MRGQSNHSSRFIEMFETTVHVYKEVPITALCHTDDDIKCGPFGTQLKQSEYQENGVAVWGIPQINSGFTIAPDTFVTPEKAKKLEQFSLISGDIAMSRKGNVGQCALYPDNFEKGIIASDVVRIRVNKDLIMPQFLVYQLHNSYKVRQQILNVSDGSIMAGINVTKLKKIHVYSTPLERQKQFVSIVKQSDKSKFTNFKSRFIEITKSERTQHHALNKLTSIERKNVNPIRGTIYTLYSFPAYDNNRIPEVIDGGDIKSSKLLLTSNTVLYNKLNVRLRRVWNIKELKTNNNICSSEFIPLKVNKDVVLQEYLMYCLTSDTVTEMMESASQGTSNSQQRISPSSLMQVSIPVIPKNEQKHFIELYQQSDKSKYLS